MISPQSFPSQNIKNLKLKKFEVKMQDFGKTCVFIVISGKKDGSRKNAVPPIPHLMKI